MPGVPLVHSPGAAQPGVTLALHAASPDRRGPARSYCAAAELSASDG
jgi:hypothetical protein